MKIYTVEGVERSLFSHLLYLFAKLPLALFFQLLQVPGLERSPGKEGCPLQYSNLEHSSDCILHGADDIKGKEDRNLNSQEVVQCFQGGIACISHESRSKEVSAKGPYPRSGLCDHFITTTLHEDGRNRHFPEERYVCIENSSGYSVLKERGG